MFRSVINVPRDTPSGENVHVILMGVAGRKKKTISTVEHNRTRFYCSAWHLDIIFVLQRVMFTDKTHLVGVVGKNETGTMLFFLELVLERWGHFSIYQCIEDLKKIKKNK